MGEETVKFTLVKSMRPESLREFYSVEVWTSPDLMSFQREPHWRHYGQWSTTLEGAREEADSAREFHSKVRITKTTNEEVE